MKEGTPYSVVIYFDSQFYTHSDFAQICNVIQNVDRNNILIGGGDLNARVADVKLQWKNYIYRVNPDPVINLHGLELLKICKSFKCYILNNLTKGNNIFDGKITFRKGERSSQNDILISKWKRCKKWLKLEPI